MTNRVILEHYPARSYRGIPGMDGFAQHIADMEGVQAALHLHADAIARKARMDLMLHRQSGAAEITRTNGRIDAYVSMVDLSEENAAMSIEFGRSGFIDKDGTVWGKMEGLHILTRAAHLPPGHAPKVALTRLNKAVMTGKFYGVNSPRTGATRVRKDKSLQ